MLTSDANPRTPRSYLALVRFAHQCLASQLWQQQQQQKQQQTVQGSTAAEVPGVYLTLLEGALTRDATSELVAAALQVGRQAAAGWLRTRRAPRARWLEGYYHTICVLV